MLLYLARMVNLGRRSIIRAQLAVYIFPQIVKVHSLVAFKLFFVDLHRVGVNAGLLSLPIFEIWIKLKPIKIVCV
jgi:hypothetical protein